jgi:hypothetical protein
VAPIAAEAVTALVVSAAAMPAESLAVADAAVAKALDGQERLSAAPRAWAVAEAVMAAARDAEAVSTATEALRSM